MNAASRNNLKPGNQVKSQKHLCKYTHQQLSEIFKKIGSKTQTQEVILFYQNFCFLSISTFIYISKKKKLMLFLGFDTVI